MSPINKEKLIKVAINLSKNYEKIVSQVDKDDEYYKNIFRKVFFYHMKFDGVDNEYVASIDESYEKAMSNIRTEYIRKTNKMNKEMQDNLLQYRSIFKENLDIKEVKTYIDRNWAEQIFNERLIPCDIGKFNEYDLRKSLNELGLTNNEIDTHCYNDTDMHDDSKCLYLPLKKQWYDMIESGIKKEEYREIKPYWNARLNNKRFDTVCFSYGYSHRKMTFCIKNISIKEGNPEWGAELNKKYYVICLGKRIN